MFLQKKKKKKKCKGILKSAWTYVRTDSALFRESMWPALLGSWTQDFCLFKELWVLLQTVPGLRAEHASSGGKICREKLLTTFSSPFFPLCCFFLSPACGSAVPILVFMKWLAYVRTYQVINHIDQEIHWQEIHVPYSNRGTALVACTDVSCVFI